MWINLNPSMIDNQSVEWTYLPMFWNRFVISCFTSVWMYMLEQGASSGTLMSYLGSSLCARMPLQSSNHPSVIIAFYQFWLFINSFPGEGILIHPPYYNNWRSNAPADSRQKLCLAMTRLQGGWFEWRNMNCQERQPSFCYKGWWGIQYIPCSMQFIPWVSCQIRKIAGCACAGNAGNVFPATAG